MSVSTEETENKKNLVGSNDINIVSSGDDISLELTNAIKQALTTSVVSSYSENNSDVYNAPYINNCNIYSTSETFTGKYWMDGKPIYRKTFSTTVTQNNADTTVPNSVITNLDTMVIIFGTLKNTYDNRFPLNYISPNEALTNALGCYYSYNDGIKIRVGNTALGTGAPVYVVLEYTKTTD